MTSKLLLGYLLFTIAAVGYLSFAEAKQATIDVPFDYGDNGCILFEDGEVPLYQCYFEGILGTTVEQPEEQPETKPTIKPDDDPTDDPPTDDSGTPTSGESQKKTANEKIIEQLEEECAKMCSYADSELLRLLKELDDVCTLGIDEGAPVQTYAEFDIPSIDPRVDYKAIDYSKNVNLGNIVKKIEECSSWNEYKPYGLGPQYANKIIDDSTSQGHHADKAVMVYTYPDIPSVDKSKATFCAMPQINHSVKKDYDCFVPIYETVPGEIHYYSDALTNYKNYLEDDGAEQLRQLKQKAIAERLESLR